jgi:predicted ArsR family transcriptional regulator
VSLPARRYDLAARLLAAAVDEAIRTGVAVAGALARIAGDHGRRLGERVRQHAGKRPSRRALLDAALVVLGDEGYEPRADGRDIRLANCPFDALVDEQRDLVCGMNNDLLCGLASVVGDDVLSARLEPSVDNCCVRLHASATATSGRR